MTETPSTNRFFRRKRLELILSLAFTGALVYAASALTGFSFSASLQALPKVFVWTVQHLVPDAEAVSRLPKILEKLGDTVLLAVMSTVSAAVFALIFALLGCRTTSPHRAASFFARAVASVNRNIPVAAWAMIFLISFGQSDFTGYLALFFATFGFLTRAFMETIDEASSRPVQALRACGGNEMHVITQALLPASLPQMVSWILYMIETNIRSATLVGLLTGSGIGFMFDIYYKSLQYSSAALLVLCIVAVVLCIELLSNTLRRIIL